MGILSLLWSSDFTGTNSPDWLVGDDDVAPLGLSDLVDNSLELSGVDFSGLAGFSFFEELTNAEHDIQSIFKGDFGLEGNI